jgi:hypothetical protein
MGTNFRHTDAATLMGAWPFSPHPDGAGVALPSFQPEVTLRQATIRSIKREPSSGFALDGLSFYLYIDGQTVGDRTTVSFAGGDPWTVDDVVTRINTLATVTVAYNENGFLLLKSPTVGGVSYLKLESFPTTEHVFDLLGLFAETESYAGDIASPGHPDPSRQVSYPGQATMPWGGAFDAAAFNRAAMAMAINTDRTAGLLDRKRVATRKEVEIVYNGTDLFIQIPDVVYSGTSGSPDMEDLVAILDDDHNEILVEKHTPLGSDFSCNVTTDPDSGEMTIWMAAGLNFNTVDDGDSKGEYYVRIYGFAGLPAAIDNVPLKILNVLDASSARIQNIDPVTGDRVSYTGTGGQADRMVLETKMVKAEGLYKESSLATNISGWSETKEIVTLGTITRIEKNNVVFCSGADFSSVAVGDEVIWAASAITDPWSNDGTYRVGRKIDNKTLELVSSEGGPVMLNPREGSPSGVIEVRTDGRFWDQPYIKFDDNEIKPPAGTVRIVYLGLSTVRDALTSDPTALAGSVKYAQETDFEIQKALMGVVGPSVDTFQDVLNWLYSDRRRNLDGIFSRLDYEHHTDDSENAGGFGGPGRHSNIRPDTIDMFPEVSGSTVTLRSATGETAGSPAGNRKLRLVDASGTEMFAVLGDGSVVIGDFSTTPPYDIYVNKSATSPAGDDARVRLRTNSASGFVEQWLEAAGSSGYASQVLYGNRTAVETDTFGCGLMSFGRDDFEGSSWMQFTHQKYGLAPSNDLLKLDFQDGSTVSFLWTKAIMAWRGNGNVGIGLTSPNTNFVIKARSISQQYLQEIQGFDATQVIAGMQFRVHPAGIVSGSLYAEDAGAGAYSMWLKANDMLALETTLSSGIIAMRPGGSRSWYFNTSGHFVPNSGGTHIIGASNEVERIDVRNLATSTNPTELAHIGKGSSENPLRVYGQNFDGGIGYMTFNYQAAAYNGGVQQAIMTVGVAGLGGGDPANPLNYILSRRTLTIRNDTDDTSLYLNAAGVLFLNGGARAGSTAVNKRIELRTAGSLRWTIDNNGHINPSGSLSIGNTNPVNSIEATTVGATTANVTSGNVENVYAGEQNNSAPQGKLTLWVFNDTGGAIPQGTSCMFKTPGFLPDSRYNYVQSLNSSHTEERQKSLFVGITMEQINNNAWGRLVVKGNVRARVTSAAAVGPGQQFRASTSASGVLVQLGGTNPADYLQAIAVCHEYNTTAPITDQLRWVCI